MSDQDFFVELQGEFLTEAIFMLEQYEESMLGLENGSDPEQHLTTIFRVAHSIKGGASAVGFTELSVFAHKVEDLLAILRVSPHLVNSSIISVLLKSGDEFKKRLHELKDKPDSPWDPSQLLEEVLVVTNQLNGVTAPPAGAAPVETTPAPAAHEDTPAAQAEVEVLDLDLSKPDAPASLVEELVSADVPPIAQVQAISDFDSPPVVEPPALSVAPAASSQKVPAPKANETAKSNIPKSNAVTSIKVDLARLDSVLDAVGEIVVLKNQLIHDDSVKSGENSRLVSVVDQLDKSVRELYEKTLGMRMTPLKSLFLKIQRIVRDVSLQLNKPVNLNLIGEETEVERTVFEILGDPMVHLIRNALDHGIEKQEVRQERGKNLTANLTVSAKQLGGQVLIEIVDDGGGINREKVLAKAVEKNLLPPGTDPATMSNDQVFQLIFAPGFSTADKISDLSGRGVGLDVVRSNLERVHGKIEIESTPNKGSTFRLLIPLSTAITDGIVVTINKQQFILPIHSIKELVRIDMKCFTQVSNGQKVARIREQLIPVADLTHLFGFLNFHFTEEKPNATVTALNGQRQEDMLVIIETPIGLIGLPVHDILGQTQAVVKPLQLGQKIAEISGAAVLGDGSTVLILDPVSMVMQHRSTYGETTAAA